MGKTSFVLGSSWASRMLDVPDEDFSTIVKAVFRYAVDGEQTDVPGLHGALVKEMTDFIADNNEKYEEVCKKRREAGAIGGKQKVANAKQMLPNAKQKVANGSKCLHDNEYDNDYDNDNEDVDDNDTVLPSEGSKRKDAIASKRERHKYGQYNNVLLSDDDLQKLKDEFPDDWQDRIERLSEYIESKGAKYKNHLATIRAWARKNNDRKPKPNDRPYAFRVIDEMDFGEGSIL